jgi:hypothetical protein
MRKKPKPQKPQNPKTPKPHEIIYILKELFLNNFKILNERR